MKFATLTGLVSLVCADKFLEIQKEVINFSAASEKKAWTDLHKIDTQVGEGFCQPMVDLMIWDLKPLDANHAIDIIYDEKVFNKSAFGIKLCEREFESTEFKDHTIDGTKYTNTITPIENAGNAYWLDFDTSSEKLKPLFSFDSANFTPTKTSDGEYTGWTLKYVSNQPCDAGQVSTTSPPSTTPFIFTTTGICDKSATTPVYSDYKSSGCSAGVTVTSVAGCVAVDGEAFFKAIEPYMGVIGIIVGGLMTFAGAMFLIQLVAASIGIFVTVFVYAVFSNLFFTIKTGTGAKVGVLVLALALAGAATFFGYKFAKAWGVSVIAALGGAMGFKLLLSVCGVMNVWAQLAGVIAGAVAGAYLGRKFNVFVRTVGTAFLGSYILMRGCGFVFGGFPNGASDLKNIHANNKVVYYFLGFLVAFIAGSLVQYKLFHEDAKKASEEDGDGDAFGGEDEGKKCGCF